MNTAISISQEHNGMKRSLSHSQKKRAELYSWSAVPQLPVLNVFHTCRRCTQIQHYCKPMLFKARIERSPNERFELDHSGPAGYQIKD